MNRRMLLRGAVAVVALAGAYWGYTQLSKTKPTYKDLAYAEGERQKLDIYLPEGNGPFPFVFDIHGGAFKMGSKDMTNPSATLLAAGIAVIRPNYRLSGTDAWPAQGDDVLAAMTFVRENAAEYKLDAARFATWGQSAGGFLSVSLALTLTESKTPPSAVVDFYGPMDFAKMDEDLTALGRSPTMGATSAADSPESVLLGYSVGENLEKATAMGPIGRLSGLQGMKLPPLFIRHGDADPMIAHLQSERLRDAWTAADPASQVDFALVVGGVHGGSAFDADDVMLKLRDFLLTAFGS